MTAVMTPSNTDTITAGQIGKFEDLLGARLRKSGLSSSTVQRVIETNGDTVADQMLAIVRKHVEALDVLTFRGTIEVELPFDLDPADHYQDDPDRLYVYGQFDGGSLVKRAKSLSAGTKFRLNIHEITAQGGATDEQIEAALGGNHLFDETTICGFYAALMAAQPKGEEGHLLNNGYANLAYLSSCVADVSRRVGLGRWLARTWRRGGRRWGQGRRVFSPAN